VRRSLFQLAPSIDEFRERADELGALIDKIDAENPNATATRD
jgi:hypothetical protein